MVRVQRLLWPRDAAEAAPVQAELWEPLHYGTPSALCQPHPTRVHAGMSAQRVLPLGGQLRLEHVLSGLWSREEDEERALRQRSRQRGEREGVQLQDSPTRN